MPTFTFTKVARFSFLFTFLLATLGSVYHGEDESDSEPPPISDENAHSFTVMDVEAMNVYRDERRTELIESLTLSNLSTEHQELIANAIAKSYIGIPVSSFTYSSEFESSQEEDAESTVTYHVRSTGHIQRENLEVYHGLDTNNPFVYFPPVPFVSETGKLIKESDSSAQFAFDFKFPMEDMSEDDMMADFVETMKWTFEVTVSKADQAPEHITLKLAKPIRKRFLFKLTTFQLDFHYSYVDSCDCFAVSKLNTQMKGSALFVGKLDETVELTFTDISCEEPVRFLLPETEGSSILMF
ncbi:MAG: hypothetical protein F4X56_08580 [Gammaproteobacteria bacterium]|nr:hypothetical protein [Gammaproteobacteria bacterium]